MSEPRAQRLKRLKMQSMRRGIREMDLILTAYAEANLAGMDPAWLDRYDALLEQNDQELYQWVTGRTPAPDGFAELIRDISQTFQKQ